ncbi:MAG: hypothetical protein JWP67_2331 [Mucilaginibacter sp.]|nr:hypothetical protein [Mucilaginibacter sp.]
MKFLYRFFILTTICYLCSCSKKSDADLKLIITSVLPATAGMGDTLSISGKNFNTLKELSVTINDKSVTILKNTDNNIKILIPKLLGSGFIKVSAGGNVYKGPYFNYKYKATVTTLAGSGYVGSTNGKETAASFYCPWGITADLNGDLYIADTYNRLIRKIAAGTNEVSTIPIPTYISGGNFYSPYNIAIDTKTRNLYVTDFNQHVMRIAPNLDMSLIFNSSEIGTTTTGIAAGPDGYIYMSLNTQGKIVKFDPANNYAYSTFTTGLITPRNIIFDNTKKMYVAAFDNLKGPVILQIDDTGTASVVHFDLSNKGWEIAIDSAGNFYEADHFSNNLKMIEKNGLVTVIAGSGKAEDIDGVGVNASFNGPQGITIDTNGNLYITTYNYDTKGGNKVRKVVIE